MFLVYPQLPRAGLGNMLLVWANAVLFGELNTIPVIAPNWGQIKIGPYLRGEREKRYYGNLFNTQNYVSKFRYFLTKLSKQHIYYNPAISQLDLSDSKFQDQGCYLFVFNQLPHWSDSFKDLKEYQPFIKQRLLASIRQPILQSIPNNSSPEIGIHIRMGDFQILKPDHDFAKVGSTRTPIKWYLNVLSAIREIVGYDVPATIFSDGHDHELVELLSFPAVYRSTSGSALSDMFMLSRSKLLITSAGSTFSGWASYLGQCPTIWHPAHFHAGVFPQKMSNTIFEGGFDPTSMEIPGLLMNNVQSLFHNYHV